ncbi:MAG: ADP-ribosylglycohydrolase family protein, partial [Candidatus Bathyarchaeota archaeon]|nr:ADP-ribosylglycohydrolase family protein [Candidatus Bathyarchaeota archaeon]
MFKYSNREGGLKMKSCLGRKNFFVVLMCAAVLGVVTEAANGGQVRAIDRADYADRLRALWLGECIANWTGMQTEGHRSILPFYDDSDWGPGGFDFILDQDPWWADDDTDIEYVYCHLLHQHQTTMLSAQQIRDGWMTHINRYIWVSDAKARSLMNDGHTTPQTGMLALNSLALMIDAQLTTEIFGALAPGMPGIALQMADLPIRTTATGYAAHAAQYFVLLYSLASNVSPNMSREKQIIWLADEARKYIPDTSKSADIYDFVKADYLANPDKDDWESTRKNIYMRYQYFDDWYGFRYQAWWESSVNFAAGIMALLYGEGDYRKTVKIATLAGWDSDNSTATLGGLLGLMYGYDELIAQFPGTSFSDRYRINRTRDNMPDYLPADYRAEDTFTMLANRMLEIINMTVRDAGGTVDSRNNRWLLPRATSRVALEQNPLYREMQGSANNRVRQLGGTVTAESSVSVSSYIEKMADGFEHNFAGEEWWRTLEPWFYSTEQGSGHSGEIQALSVTYDRLVEVSVIRYIEGKRGSGGGWFTSADVEVKIDGLWQSPPGSVIATEALNPNQDYQIIDYILSEPVEATGIRITGPVGGSNGYVTALELDAFAYAPPVARADNYGVVQDRVLNVDAEWGVLANDITYGGVLTAILVSGPSNGSLSLNSDGSFEYVPDAGFMGMDSFTYKANAGEGESNVAT